MGDSLVCLLCGDSVGSHVQSGGNLFVSPSLEIPHGVFRCEEARRKIIAALRSICEDFGDNDWADTLHPADVIEKHLGRHLYATEPRWIAVTERLPAFGRAVVVASDSEYVGEAKRDPDWRWADGEVVTQNVTHWMPLPEAPK